MKSHYNTSSTECQCCGIDLSQVQIFFQEKLTDPSPPPLPSQVLDIKLVFFKLSIGIKSIMCEHESTFYSSFNCDKITIVNPPDEKTK